MAAMRAVALAGSLAGALAVASGARAQQAASPFGGFQHDASQPIEITADVLEVRQAESVAIFTGGVVAGQGTLRLTAERLSAWYDAGAEGGGDIDRLRAEGGVFLSSGGETARGEWAEYDVVNGRVTMGGGVVLTQGENAIRGERLSIDLVSGQGRIEGGRVQSVFNPAARRP
ncbi:MAG: lipopolysaccharide transport periplasmic protein LptA [Rhodobacteraceae bacterium]|nr:MAG: lipopolysaccharide transport periplasmic protein LptA [Paracoccaceae bacterium]